VEAIADSSGWNWRAPRVRFNLSFYPADCCHWGVYEAAKYRSSGSGDGVRRSGPAALRRLHELAHAWQYRQNRFAQIITDYATWGFSTNRPGPGGGGRLPANVWGAAGGHSGAARPPPGPWPPAVQRRLALTMHDPVRDEHRPDDQGQIGGVVVGS